jgi:hypothetical protein
MSAIWIENTMKVYELSFPSSDFLANRPEGWNLSRSEILTTRGVFEGVPRVEMT